MSTSFGQTAEPTPAAPAPAAESQTAAPEATAPPAGAGSETPAVHPSWQRALDHIPEAWRAPIVQEFQNADREAQKAIENARAQATPQEWQGLLEQARANGVSPEELIDAYNGQIDLRARIAEDPDAFLAEISDFIDQQVASGQLTRKQATQARKEVAAAAASADPEDPLYESPESQAVKELQARLDAQDAQRKAELEAQQQAESDRAAQEYADNFLATFDNALKAQGLDQIPVPLQHQLALTADSILGANPQLSEQQAIDMAVTNFRQSLSQLGAQIPQAAAAAPAPAGLPPVLGAGTGTPPPAQAPSAPTGAGKSAEAVRVMREMLGQQ